jgi:hypothetical protein
MIEKRRERNTWWQSLGPPRKLRTQSLTLTSADERTGNSLSRPSQPEIKLLVKNFDFLMCFGWKLERQLLLLW